MVSDHVVSCTVLAGVHQCRAKCLQACSRGARALCCSDTPIAQGWDIENSTSPKPARTSRSSTMCGCRSCLWFMISRSTYLLICTHHQEALFRRGSPPPQV